MKRLKHSFCGSLVFVMMVISTSNGLGNMQDGCSDLDSTAGILEGLCQKGEFDSVLTWRNGLMTLEEKPCTAWQKIYVQFGKAYSQKEQFNQAIGDYEMALTYSNGDDKTLISIYMYMSSVHRRSGSGDMSLRYMRKALKTAKDKNITEHNPDLFNSYANILSRSNLDSAIVYYKKALESYGSKCASCRSTVLNNLGSMYAIRADFNESIKYFKQALAIDTVAKDSLRIMRTLFNIGRFEFVTGQLSKSEQHLNQSIELAKKYDWNMSVPLMSNLIGGIKASNNDMDAAYRLFINAASLQDSMLRANSAEAISEAVSSFELSQAELQNSLLAKENEIIKKDRRIQQTSLSMAIVIALLLFLIVVVIWRQRKKLHNLNHSLDLQNEKLRKNLEEKDQLMGILSHDLRTPMNSMLSISSLLLEPELTQDEKEDFLFDIKSSAESGIELINDLINLYREESTTDDIPLSNLDLPQFLEEIYDPYQGICKAKNQVLQTEISGVATIKSNPNALKSALGNLLSNAAKFSPVGGTVGIKASTINGKVCISISDSGPGFNNADKEKIFNKFSRLSAQPTGNENSSGLGLYTVKLMLDKIGGTIELANTSKSGSTFTVTLKPE